MKTVNKSLETVSRFGDFNPENLKESQYTVSLLKEAFRARLLNKSEINNIQAQIILILKELIQQYTRGESSSLRIDRAESLLCSIMYCIDAWCIGETSPYEAVEQLKTTELKEIYKKGVECVAAWFDETKGLFSEIRKNKLDVDIESYNLTISEVMPLFFEKYNVVFDSHNAIASIDYPLVFDDMSIQGVLYIKRYLEHFYIETLFCKYFREQDITRLLNNYGSLIKMNYKIELINIFELVINNAVFSVISGKIANDLIILPYDFEIISTKLKNLPDGRAGKFIESAVDKLLDILNITNPELTDYVDKYKPVLSSRIIKVLEDNSLDSLIIVEHEEKSKAGLILFDFGERMGDREFNLLIRKLAEAPGTEDKINLIKSGIKSFYDFIDMLNSGCLYGDEFEVLFSSLGYLELAVLAKVTFYEELRENIYQLSSAIHCKKEVEYEWQKYFIEILKKSNRQKLDFIITCIGEIEYEEINFY